MKGSNKMKLRMTINNGGDTQLKAMMYEIFGNVYEITGEKNGKYILQSVNDDYFLKISKDDFYKIAIKHEGVRK